MTNGQVIELYEALKKIESQKEFKMPILVGYALAKDLDILTSEVRIISDLQKKIILSSGNLQDNDEIIVPKEKIDEVNKKINELMNMENGIELLKIPILNFQEMEFSLEEMKNLYHIIEIDAG